MSSHKSRFKKIRTIVAKIVCAAIVVWLIGDFGYSRYIQFRIERWESSIERDFSGVQAGCGAFEMGEGPIAVLLVHGFNDNPSAFAKIAPELAEQGFSCRATRLRGFAKPLPEYGRSKAEQWTAQIAREVAELKQTHRHVWVMAHSLGGAATINALLEHNLELDGLILLAPAIEISSQRSPLLSARSWHEIGKSLLVFTTVVENPFTIDAKDRVEAEREDRCKFSPIATVDELFFLIDKNRGRAGEIQTPTLMVLTEDDRVIDFEACRIFFEQLGSPTKEMVLNNRSGHALPYDFGWEKIVTEAIRFIRDNQSEPSPPSSHDL